MTDPRSAHPDDPHYINRAGWLRASVLGANDGIVSVASLVVGVAAANPAPSAVLIAGVAGLVAGAMSMAAGVYISVSPQADIERADIARQKLALQEMPDQEIDELTGIYESHGLSAETARQVAEELTATNALAAHIREELGVTDGNSANPLQAALASCATFSLAAAIPLLAVALAPPHALIGVVLCVTLLALGAIAGGAP